MKKNLSFQEYLNVYIKSATPIISVDTCEIDRATAEIKLLVDKSNESIAKRVRDNSETAPKNQCLRENGYAFKTWDVINGWSDSDGNRIKGTASAVQALHWLLSTECNAGVYVMHNFHLIWDTSRALFIQLFRLISEHSKYNHKHIILVGLERVPEELRNTVISLSFNLPVKEELEKYIADCCEELNKKETKKDIELIAEAAVGMTLNEIENAIFVSAVVNPDKKLDRGVIFEEKAQKIKQSGLLEYVKSDETINTAGGLDTLKRHIESTAYIFHNFEKATRYGLKPPKGVLLAGLAGTGKSLFSKIIANTFQVPLFRSDLGRLFGGLVGETERNVRELIKLVTSLAPCCLLMDEIEKMFAGNESSGRSDSGVTSRVTASLLYWLQEKKEPIYVIGTMNSVSLSMSSAHIRSGRWDGRFWFDLPTEQEREQIFCIHLHKVGRKANKYDVSKLAKISNQYTGAEIENAIYAGMKVAFKENRDFDTNDIIFGLSQETPIAKIKESEVESMRKWARESGIIPASGLMNNLNNIEETTDKKRRIL